MQISESEEDVYDVERIVDSRIKNGKKQYLIKWVGYSESENTWEMEENLMCGELLEEYKKKEMEAKKTATSTKKKEEMRNTKQQSSKISSVKSDSTSKSNNVSKNASNKMEVKESESKNIAINNIDQKKTLKNNPEFKREENLFEQQISSSFQTSRVVTNDWDGYIKKVVGAFLNKDGKLEIEFLLFDGSKGTTLSQDLKYKAPLKLIEFYEENLSFPE